MAEKCYWFECRPWFGMPQRIEVASATNHQLVLTNGKRIGIGWGDFQVYAPTFDEACKLIRRHKQRTLDEARAVVKFLEGGLKEFDANLPEPNPAEPA